MGGMSSDNIHGLILALSSSVFIGSSFIIKKKGLMKAGATGIRAGSGGYSYLKEPWWWSGMVSMIIGEVANFAAYTYAPAILVTPLGALSMIISAVLAHYFLDERLHIFGVIGCALCLVGSTTIVLHAPQETQVTSVKEVWYFATKPGTLYCTTTNGFKQILCHISRIKVDQNVEKRLLPLVSTLTLNFRVLTGFLVYACIVLVVVGILIYRYVPLYGGTHLVIYVGICSIMGSLTVMCVKAVGIAMKLSFSGSNQFIYISKHGFSPCCFVVSFSCNSTI